MLTGKKTGKIKNIFGSLLKDNSKKTLLGILTTIALVGGSIDRNRNITMTTKGQIVDIREIVEYRNVTRTVKEDVVVPVKSQQTGNWMEKLIGAGVGAAVGSLVGGGNGNKVAMGAGALIGGSIGDRLASQPETEMKVVTVNKRVTQQVPKVAGRRVTVVGTDGDFETTVQISESRAKRLKVGDMVNVKIKNGKTSLKKISSRELRRSVKVSSVEFYDKPMIS